MFMSRGTRKPPWGTSGHAPGSWLAGRILSVVVLLAVGVPFVALAAMVLGAVTDPESDPHGYTEIFGTAFLVLLLVPMVLSVVATLLLFRRKRAGFIVLAVTAGPFAFALMSLTGFGILVGLAAVAVMAIAITGFVVTGRAPASGPPASGPPATG